MKNQKSKIKIQKYNAKLKTLKKFFKKFFFIIPSLILFTVLGSQFFVAAAHAAVGINKQVNFQGKLVNADGTNVSDGSRSVVFTLYTAASGGTQLWQETQSVTTTDGIFQVALGSSTSLATVDFNSDSIYLGIKVGSDSEMTPRVRFAAVPYAFNAEKVGGVTATQSATGFTLQGGTSTQSTASFTTSGGTLTFKPGVAAGLTIESNGANALSIDTGGAAALTIGGTNQNGLTLGRSGANTTIASLTSNGFVKTSGGTGLLSVASTINLATEASGILATANGGSWWNATAGALHPGNTTLDLLLGGTATTSAKFAVLNMNANTPTASISATTTGLVLGGDGNIQSLRNGTLTLGGNTTGHIALAPAGSTALTLNSAGNVGIGTTKPNKLLELSAVKDATLRLNSTQDSSSWTANTDTAGQIEFYTNDASGDGANVTSFIKSVTTATAGNLWALTFGTSTNNAAATEKMRIDSSGNIGINTTSPTALLDVAGTASISGGLKLRSTSVLQSMNMQTLTLGGDTTGHIAFAAGGSGVDMTLTSAGSLGIGTAAPGARLHVSGGEFLLDNGREIRFYDTDGTSARTVLTVTNIGNTVLRGANSSGRLDIRNQGDITFLALIDSSGFIGTGNVNTSPLASFDIRPSLRSTSGTISVASVSGSTSFAAMTVDNNGVGDLFTASKSGATKFVVKNSGNVGIGNTTPGLMLHVGSSAVTDGTSVLRLQDANSTCDLNANAVAPLCGSDITLKKDIASLDTTDLLGRVSNLRPVSYRWKTQNASDPLQYGFIAQEVAEQFSDLVTEGQWIDGTTRKFLNLGGMMPYAIGAIKELNAKVDSSAHVNELLDLKSKVASLEGELQIQQLTIDNLQLILNASSAAELGLDKLTAGTLNVLGRATFTDVGITGKVNVGLLTVNGLDECVPSPFEGEGQGEGAASCATINTTAGTLSLQSHGLYGLDILDGKVTIAANGDMNVEGALTVEKINIDTEDVAAASAGTVIMKTGQLSVDVDTAALTPTSLIFATPDQPIAIGAKAKDEDTFTIKLQTIQHIDVKVNWWLIN